MEFPLGQAAMEVRDALAQHGRRSGWNEELEAFDNDGSGAVSAAGIEPQNTEGQGRIDGGLHFRRVHAEYGEG